MSTTSQQTALSEFVPEPSSPGFDPSEAFDELVLDEPDVCNSCFAVIKRDHRKREAGEHGHDEIEHDPYGEHVVRVGEHVGEVDVEPEDVYGELTTYPSRTVCGECGSIAGRSPSETLSRREALERVPALTQRLQDHGLLVDDDAIRHVVRHLKSEDAYAGRDMDIYRAAVAIGIRRGRGLASR